jgi:hypothetical protein
MDIFVVMAEGAETFVAGVFTEFDLAEEFAQSKGDSNPAYTYTVECHSANSAA